MQQPRGSHVLNRLLRVAKVGFPQLRCYTFPATLEMDRVMFWPNTKA